MESMEDPADPGSVKADTGAIEKINNAGSAKKAVKAVNSGGPIDLTGNKQTKAQDAAKIVANVV